MKVKKLCLRERYKEAGTCIMNQKMGSREKQKEGDIRKGNYNETARGRVTKTLSKTKLKRHKHFD